MNGKKYRLGLDVGTNSLGWSVLELDAKTKPCAILAAGSRIFAEGREAKTKATLAATRRGARSARRRRDRFKQRQTFLLSELIKAGLFPKASEDRHELQKRNPLELRSDALRRQLRPWEVGRALFHLNQRRGFKSNRKDQSEETVSGVVSRSARLLLEDMKLIGPEANKEDIRKLSPAEKKQIRQDEAQARKEALGKLNERKDLSYGSFLHQRRLNGQPTRARPATARDGKLYDVYPTRELYEDEFQKIWQTQAAYHPELMTISAKERIHRAIFHQRPLKPQKRGKCAYMSDEDRTFRALPSFQRYRIYQEVNSLEWWDLGEIKKVRDYREARDEIVNLLENVSTNNGQLTFGKMKNILKRIGITEGNFKFNFETEKRKGLDGNLTSNLMRHEDRIGPSWHDWPLAKQDDFIDTILNGTPQHQERDRKRLDGVEPNSPPDGAKDDEDVLAYLCERFGLPDHIAENCMNSRLKDDTASISLRAARLMLEKMRDGVVDAVTGEIVLPPQSDAASAVALEEPSFIDPSRSKGDDGKYRLLNKLPYYGEAFQDGRHIISGTGKPEDDDKTRWGGVTNPTVHIALNQIRLVVNELIDRFGRPESIAIELGRDLPLGPKKRGEIEREQKENQARNEKFDATLTELGQKPNAGNRLRLFLWHELSDDPNGRCCPFSGRTIGIADLFNGSTEIEHLIPFSRSLDDSRANKVVCTRDANQFKGNRTPFEAFGGSPDGYNWSEIGARAEALPSSKGWRFKPDAWDIWQQGADGDFTSRHLNDTRYIGRLTREYLETICHVDRIDVVTGRLTSLLRRHWDLNRVLDDGSDRKNRDDHRHHAVDAIVVGMTSRSLLQKVSTKARELESCDIDPARNLSRFFAPAENPSNRIDPWSRFRNDVESFVSKIVVSHKARRKSLASPHTTDGQLHNDTAYGLVQKLNDDGLWEVVSRKPVTGLKKLQDIESIRDPRLREAFKSRFEAAEASTSGSGYKAVQDMAGELNIRRVRCIEKLSVIGITDKFDNTYKAYKGDSNWGIEIYSWPTGHKKAGKWEGVMVPRFDAHQNGFRPGFTFRPHPAARLIMRLRINDCIQMLVAKESEERRIYRLQKVSKNRMSFAEIHEANVDSRNRSKEEKFKYSEVAASTLQSLQAKKVHISPTGLVSCERRRRYRRAG